MSPPCAQVVDGPCRPACPTGGDQIRSVDDDLHGTAEVTPAAMTTALRVAGGCPTSGAWSTAPTPPAPASPT
jgi:hypothetical protein